MSIKCLKEEYEVKVVLLNFHRPSELRAFATKNSQVLEVKLLEAVAGYLMAELRQKEYLEEQTINSSCPTY